MFITFEGIEGAGKGTALARTNQWLISKGRRTLITREPGGSALGRELRSMLLSVDQAIEAEAELFLYLADRAQHVRRIIRPALARGEIVLSDRYADSTLIYQGCGRGLDQKALAAANAMAVGGLWPDLTFLLDLPPETGLARARARNKALGLEILEGRFEAEDLAFHRRVRQGYLALAAEQPRVCILEASRPPEAVFQDIQRLLEPLLLPSP
ncbi:MAG: dTMP kinase [Deltaproteobacteria bacterium]|jgi:dTMP kinase|nr:dTMP kinase [Deltaproteobacteria bacterium]